MEPCEVQESEQKGWSFRQSWRGSPSSWSIEEVSFSAGQHNKRDTTHEWVDVEVMVSNEDGQSQLQVVGTARLPRVSAYKVLT